MKDIILIGDGLGVRTFPSKAMGLSVLGTDLSEYAVKHCHPEIKDCYIQDDIINTKIKEKAKLVIAYDILEHLSYKNLDKAINNLIRHTTKHILISVPYKGTPPATADPTHIIIEDREFWIKKFTDKGLKLIKTPDHFQYKEQILIFEKVIK